MKKLLRAGCALASALLLAACQQEVYMDLTETSANEMIAALASAGITASKSEVPDHSWQITVDSSEVPAALNTLHADGLPRQPTETLGELFHQQGLVTTPAEERVRYIYGAEQELERTLLDVNGVIVAHVHVVIPENDPLSDKLKPSSASVYIKYRAGVDLKLMAPMVKDLVAHSIEGLAYDNVSLFVQAAPPQQADRRDDAHERDGLRALPWFAVVFVLLTLLVGAVLVLRRGQSRLSGEAREGPSHAN